MISLQKHESSLFARQKMQAELESKDKRFMKELKDPRWNVRTTGKEDNGTGAGTGTKADTTATGTSNKPQATLIVKKPAFRFAPKVKPSEGLKLPPPELDKEDEPAVKKSKTDKAEEEDGDDGENAMGALLGDYGDSIDADEDNEDDDDGTEVKSFF